MEINKIFNILKHCPTKKKIGGNNYNLQFQIKPVFRRRLSLLGKSIYRKLNHISSYLLFKQFLIKYTYQLYSQRSKGPKSCTGLKYSLHIHFLMNSVHIHIVIYNLTTVKGFKGPFNALVCSTPCWNL